MKKLALVIFLIFISNLASALAKPVGVYWGFFDPPTIAHREIMVQAIDRLNLDELIIIVNEHKTKSASISSFDRVRLIKDMLPDRLLDKITLLNQDEDNMVDYFSLKQNIKEPLYVIAGQDSFDRWMQENKQVNLAKYDKIYIVPRGTLALKPISKHKKVATLSLLGESQYYEVSSSKIKNSESLAAVKHMLPENVWKFLQGRMAKINSK